VEQDCDLPVYIYTSHIAEMQVYATMTSFLLVEMGSLGLFAQAELKPQSFQSPLLKKLRLQA
jgi:hypothetical protein